MIVLEKIETQSKSSSKPKDDTAEFVPKNPKTVRKTISMSPFTSVKKDATFFERLDSNKEKLNNFRSLEFNWNYADAFPFTKTLIDKVESILEHLTVQPKIFPTGRQSIQFEYEKSNGDYLEFEIFEDLVNYLLIRKGIEVEKQIPLKYINFNQMINTFYAE
jgi:hypothetical protein